MRAKFAVFTMFCPKCGSVLLPRKDGSKKVLICSCGYKSNNVEQMKITESVAKTDKEVEVIEKESVNILPKTKVVCEKCENNEAYYWTIQTRAGDEPETKFLRCTKCRHIWRDYD